MRHLILAVAALALGACSSGSEESAAAEAPATEAKPAAAASPSFDCAEAKGEAQGLVCGDAELAAMDRELARLYDLALTGSQLGGRKGELQATQRGWIKGRNDCWKADDKRACVMAEYAMRIAELRQGYADARSDDGAGASTGPVALACDGTDFGIGLTLINTDPGAAYLSWKDQAIALAHVPSGSGAKFEGANYSGKGALFIHGQDAMVTLPGEGERTCRIEEIG